jgi:hypothetical protein
MLKNTLRALIVVTVFAAPCVTFGAQLGPGMPAPDPVFKNPTGKLGPGMPAPDPVFKDKGNSGKLGPGMPAPDPVFKNPSGK